MTHILVTFDRIGQTIISEEPYTGDCPEQYARDLCTPERNVTAYTVERWLGRRKVKK